VKFLESNPWQVIMCALVLVNLVDVVCLGSCRCLCCRRRDIARVERNEK